MVNYTLPYYLEPKCLYAWEVTQVSNSCTLILFREHKFLILFRELKFPYALEVYKCRLNAFVMYLSVKLAYFINIKFIEMAKANSNSEDTLGARKRKLEDIMTNEPKRVTRYPILL